MQMLAKTRQSKNLQKFISNIPGLKRGQPDPLRREFFYNIRDEVC